MHIRQNRTQPNAASESQGNHQNGDRTRAGSCGLSLCVLGSDSGQVSGHMKGRVQSCEGVKMHSVPEGLRSEVWMLVEGGKERGKVHRIPVVKDHACRGVRFGLELCDLGQELQEGC